MIIIFAMGIPDEEDGGVKKSAGGKAGPEGKDSLPVSEGKKYAPPSAYVRKIEGIIVRISLSGNVRFPFRY
jgi:hypothetical protein